MDNHCIICDYIHVEQISVQVSRNSNAQSARNYCYVTSLKYFSSCNKISTAFVIITAVFILFTQYRLTVTVGSEAEKNIYVPAEMVETVKIDVQSVFRRFQWE